MSTIHHSEHSDISSIEQDPLFIEQISIVNELWEIGDEQLLIIFE